MERGRSFCIKQNGVWPPDIKQKLVERGKCLYYNVTTLREIGNSIARGHSHRTEASHPQDQCPETLLLSTSGSVPGVHIFGATIVMSQLTSLGPRSTVNHAASCAGAPSRSSSVQSCPRPEPVCLCAYLRGVKGIC